MKPTLCIGCSVNAGEGSVSLTWQQRRSAASGGYGSQIEGKAAQPVSPLQLLTGDNPAGRSDVRAVSAVAAKRRGPSFRARDRHLSRDGAALVEPLRPPVRCGRSASAGQQNARIPALAVASRRDVRSHQWRDGVPLWTALPLQDDFEAGC